ncbi:hypothetical protein SDC9_155946 [bioreactor metagenome]|uniref:Uncharacterized protein n=1 Tax=bioreactor metagenome TaxID=1076179 RepID=A0A645F330_9ZZZZ
MKKKLILVLLALLMLALPAVALADTGGTAGISVADILIENAVKIAAAFFIALIGVFGAWLTAKLGKATQLDTVNRAQQELIKVAQITVGELKQTVVDGMKAASKDGKLSKEEIAQLGHLLYEKTTAKLSTSAMDVLTAAQVDISALITGTAEHLIGQMKAG